MSNKSKKSRWSSAEKKERQGQQPSGQPIPSVMSQPIPSLWSQGPPHGGGAAGQKSNPTNGVDLPPPPGTEESPQVADKDKRDKSSDKDKRDKSSEDRQRSHSPRRIFTDLLRRPIYQPFNANHRPRPWHSRGGVKPFRGSAWNPRGGYSRENYPRERWSRDETPRDRSPRERSSWDRAPRDRSPRDRSPRDRPPKDRPPRDRSPGRSSRAEPSRGGPPPWRPHDNYKRYDEPQHRFDEDIVVLHGAEWLSPTECLEESHPGRKDTTQETPALGSDEQQKESVKETLEWLKNKMKNKDLSSFGDLLKEKSRQKTSEEVPAKPARREAVSLLGSALEAESLEGVKRNLAENSRSPVVAEAVSRTATEARPKVRTGCDSAALRRGPVPESAKAKPTVATAAVPKRSGNLPPAPAPAPKPNIGLSRREPPKTAAKSSTPSTSTQRNNVMEYLHKVCGVSNIGQVKDLLMNPRPGKFEYKLRELMKQHQKNSQREALRGVEPFAVGTKNIKMENTCAEEDFMASLSDLTDCAVEMRDLPAGFVQELGDMLGFDFLGSNMGGAVEEEHVSVPVFEPPESSVPERQLEDTPVSGNKPGIRIRDFARLQGSAPPPEEARPPEENSRKDQGEQEADTTIRTAHPLDGPNLMAFVTASVNPQEVRISSDFQAPAPVPQTTANLPEPEVASEDGGKARKNSKKKSVDKQPKAKTPAASKSPDSTVCYDSEQSLESVVDTRQKQRKSSSRPKKAAKSAYTSPVDTSNSDGTGSAKALEEPEILARLQEICKEMSELSGRLKKLEAERAHLYTLLPVTRPPSTDRKKRRKDTTSSSSSDSDDGEIREIMAKQRAVLSRCGSPPGATRFFESEYRMAKKKKAKLKRGKGVSFEDEQNTLPPRPKIHIFSPPEVMLPKPTAARGSSLSSVVGGILCCDLKKEKFPKTCGVITQIKVK